VNAKTHARYKTISHQLEVSDEALGLMVDAIAAVSKKRRNFATLRDVISLALTQYQSIGTDRKRAFAELGSLTGEHRVFLRISPENQAATEIIKAELSNFTGARCSVREVTCYCCLIVLDGELLTC